MEIAASWIRAWLAEEVPTPDLKRRLVRLGYEVVETKRLDAGLAPVHLVRVVAREAHPNRSRLSIVTIDTGDTGDTGAGETRVVTGASNGFPGERLWYAPPGTTLPDGRTLGTLEFGGVPSPGMLCSAEELGLRAGPGDLLVWTGDGEPGTGFLDIIGEETILVLEMTPNLAQFAQSARGLARDLMAQAGGTLSDLPALSAPTSALGVELRAPQRCPAYALYAMPLPEQDLPIEYQRRLRASGFRLVSPMVDWTNYILMDMGQPLHAFDADRVELPIVVRMAEPEEPFIALDGAELTLTADDLVIADQRGPIALAGVMGGRHSAITAETRRVLVESAHFTAPGVYRTARRYNLRTDAAERFFRGTDPEALLPALGRLAELVGVPPGDRETRVTVVGEAPPRRRVPYDPARIRTLLSVPWSDREIASDLARLGFYVRAGEAVVPGWRPDVIGGPDLAEEVGRLRGLDDIEARVPPMVEPARPNPAHRFREDIRDLMVAAGFTETLTRVFADPRRPGIGTSATVHVLKNPIREEEGALRPELWPSLVETLAFNHDRGVDLLPLFEVNPGYRGSVETPEEFWELAAVLPFGETPTLHGRETADVYDLTGLTDLLARRLGWALSREDADPVPYLHPGRQQAILDEDRVVGRVGEIHPELLERFRLPPTGLLTLIVETPVERRRDGVLRPSRYPALTRDLSVIWPEGVLWRQARRVVKEAAGALLESVVPFDRFSGGFGESLTIRVRFRSDERTLTEEEGDRLVEAILTRLNTLGVTLRG